MTDRAQYNRDRAKARRQSMSYRERFGYEPGGVWSIVKHEPRLVNSNPIYDPRRDGPPVWSDATAYVMGDPPVGRRAIDQRGRL